jgi:nucleoside-diphosphate-sugar epimerase
MSSPEVHIRSLVIGGGGYAGWHLAMELARRGFIVKVFDVQRPSETVPDITFVEGDVTDFDLVVSASRNIDCVFHLASYGMSGREQLNHKLIEKVNIHGTDNVIKACQMAGVSRLVYTSTYNVVFGGKEIVNGDESLPYLPLKQHVDHYSRTKAIAEMKVLNANGYSVNGNTLRTCALRLAGVYGPGEQRHLPRIISYIKRGLFCCTYGSHSSLVDFLHVDNLVHAHILAAEGLTAHKQFIAAGQAYFISDCLPVNNFYFFKPLVEGLGYTYPQVRLPLKLVYYFAFITEIIHHIIGPICNFQPLLTRAEVYKTGVTHYFSIDKARHDLGYHPIVQNDMASVVKWYIEQGYHKGSSQPVHDYLKSVFIAVLTCAIFMAFLFSWVPVAS